ncbi:MAG: triphosphoribosyl-dephospho-CoA synthase [Clostridiaceae bacterium]
MDTKAYIEFLAKTTEYALEAEVWCGPKPGLVDRYNSGSHEDMDLNSFLISARTLRPWFAQFMTLAAASPTDLVLPRLRAAGMAAEKSMLKATGGANTHKGLIFSLGLVCACMVRLSLRCDRPLTSSDIPDLRNLIRLNASGLTGELTAGGHPTHGQAVYNQYGLKGIRAEAEAGFPAVFEVGLPRLADYRTQYADPDLPCLMTLLELILVTGDTNLVRRGGLTGLHFMREQSRNLLKSSPSLTPPELIQSFQRFDEAATRRNLSPGGAADHLALTLFLERALSPDSLSMDDAN